MRSTSPGFLDGVDGGIRIHDHTLAQSARFGLANTDDVKKSAVTRLASDTRHPAGSDIQADRVWGALGHQLLLLNRTIRVLRLGLGSTNSSWSRIGISFFLFRLRLRLFLSFPGGRLVRGTLFSIQTQPALSNLPRRFVRYLCSRERRTQIQRWPLYPGEIDILIAEPRGVFRCPSKLREPARKRLPRSWEPKAHFNL